MDPLPVPTEPRNPAGYVPYFYESGRFLVQSAPSNSNATVPASNSPYGIDPSPSWPADRLQSVEQIIQHGYLTVPQSEPITSILTDKRHTSWLGLDDLIGQARNRVQFYQQNAYEIEQGKCEAWNAFFRIEAEQGCPGDVRQHYAVDKRLQELYQEQRAERTTLWRDLSRIRLAVPESAQQYLSATRKLSLLNEEDEAA